MIVFNNYFKLFKKHYYIVLIYLLLFGFFSFIMTGNQTVDYSKVNLNIAVINNSNNKLSNNFIDYLNNFSNINLKYKDDRELDMKIYYRYIDYAIVIPNDFNLDSKIKIISIEQSYSTTYMNTVINNYFNMTKQYKESGIEEKKIYDLVLTTSKEEAKVNMLANDSSILSTAKIYFNYLNYILLAMVITIVGLIMFNYKKTNVIKKNMASPYGINKINFELFLANLIVGIFLWFVMILLFYVIYGNIIFNPKILLMILNSFVFFITVITLALLISNILKKRDSLGAVVNVIALSSSFLCGAFVPREFLDKSVLTIAKIYPSYWYIEANEKITNDQSVLLNILILIIYSLLFYIINLYITKHKKNN